jgi:succinate dehydrogenase / fumarate reductase flavoprotein subunit
MKDIIETDVVVIGEGCGGQAAALAAQRAGVDVTLLYNGQASSTAISTGFLTFAAHEGFPQDEVLEAMSNTTGKGLCDMKLLERLVREAPVVMERVISDYEIPVDKAPRGYRVRRSTNMRGKDMLDADYGRDGAKDMTGLMMEFSSTHGTALFSQLRKAVRSNGIKRIRGTALSVSPDGPSVWALVDGEPVKIVGRAVIIATGGMQGVYDFTDTPRNLMGDGQSMALEAGAELVDMEFIQFYPLAVNEPGVPAIFLYPDYPDTAQLINTANEDLIEKHLGAGQTSLGALHNWDELSFIIQSEIVSGQTVYIDFRKTRESDWAPDSLTGTFLSRYIPNFRERPIQIAPSSHYTIGGIRVDENGQTGVAGLYACGEVAGGVHGANRHGGTALVEAITFGDICGKHAAENLQPKSSSATLVEDAPSESAEGGAPNTDRGLKAIRQINQRGLGPYRTGALFEEVGSRITDLKEEIDSYGWDGIDQFDEVQRLRRIVRLSEAMRLSMLRRTETRGTHSRADFPSMDPAWVRKQSVSLSENGELQINDIAL